ncbi:hypothetical protein [Serratia marcescens]|uniref:hypothetical protein n=1 Tax=Serratia marcescens TaxID=615 RepID=UPI00235EFC94|nr:hypothetical protein [Serratia marcescens]
MVQRYNPDYVMHAARFAPFAREAENGEFVKFSDYENLVSELASSRQINAQTLQVKLTMAETIKELTDRTERLSGMLTESRVATKSAEERADALEVRLRNALTSEQEAIQRAHAANQTADALAVEGIELRHIAERIVNALYAAGYEPEENSLHPWKSLIFDAEKALNTPATDAALAAIKAQGVEKFAAWASEQESMASDSGDKKEARIYCQVEARAKHFAKQMLEAK